MTYCRRPKRNPWPLWLALTLAVLVLLAALRVVSALFAPPGISVAARGLPTAEVRVPSAQAQVEPRPIGQAPPVVDRLTAAPAGVVPAPTDTLAAAAPHAEPTLTITPVPLGDVGAQPIATLFPTQPAGPAPQPGVGAPAYVPILMYHYIRFVDPAIDELGYNLSTTPDDFTQQLAWLHEQGYTAVSMTIVQQCLRGEIACPPNPIALTFDDGYEDAYSTTLPIMQRFGMRGTFYIVNSFVGQPGYMNWEQLAAMRDAGMEIGAHTISHLNLTSLDQATAAYEISQSKAELDSHLGINVTSFCYPAGFYDSNIEALVQAAGYTNATTTRWDSDYSDVLALPRRRVAGGTGIDSFIGIVTGG
jgi:peptidoglycan/xylan/chitin deacetylase (PgdA/CDA1 family)